MPANEEWARYQIFVRKIQSKAKKFTKTATPIYQKKILRGIQYKEKQFLVE